MHGVVQKVKKMSFRIRRQPEEKSEPEIDYCISNCFYNILRQFCYQIPSCGRNDKPELFRQPPTDDLRAFGIGEIDFRTGNDDCRILIVAVESVLVGFIYETRVPDVQISDDESSMTNWNYCGSFLVPKFLFWNIRVLKFQLRIKRPMIVCNVGSFI